MAENRTKAVQQYFDGLNKQDLSDVPFAEDLRFEAPTTGLSTYPNLSSIGVERQVKQLYKRVHWNDEPRNLMRKTD